MRRVILTIMAVVLCLGATAQDKTLRQGRRSQHEAIYNKWQNERIAFFTSEIDLTPEEAQLFWPVYNQFLKESRSAHSKCVRALQLLKSKAVEKLTETEIQKRVDDYIACVAAQDEVFTKYAAEFKKVLPIEKVAKLYVAEEKFRIKMIRGFRDGSTSRKGLKERSVPASSASETEKD